MSNIEPETEVSTATPDRRSRQWRSLWRIHFYAGVFAFPFILLMATTGLVILYTQPIQDLAHHHTRNVKSSAATVSFDSQARAVEKTFPKSVITTFVAAKDATHATIFHIDDHTKSGRDVFVNPHTGVVLGSIATGSGIVGIANRLHGFLNNSNFKVSLPTVSALWDHDKILRPYVIGDLLLELLGVWTLVLVMSGLVLWWPRRRSSSSSTAAGRVPRSFGIRRNVTGRPRWRDLHATGGVVLFSAMAVTIISGLGWSTYSGPNFTALANKISPNAWTDTPPSPLGQRGDLDRFGNQIPWNTATLALPVSYAPADATKPAPLSLDAIVRIATTEHLKPGYQVSLPTNTIDAKTRTTTYGSFTLANSWPRKTSEARTVFIDQFSGMTLGGMNVYGYGTISRSMDTLVSVHMGTQLGVFSRIAMTALCLLAIWSVVSASVMYTKRRRPGTLGLPRRPVDIHLTRRMRIITTLMAIVFPIWGASAAIILTADRFLIRRTPQLRQAFGQR